VRRGEYDATILALAGLQRLDLAQDATYIFSLGEMLPAPGQGALAVQCRAGDARVRRMLAAIDDPDDRMATLAERHFMHVLGGGCSAPVAAHAVVGEDGQFKMQALVATVDGSRIVQVSGVVSDVGQGIALADALVSEALKKGAREILHGN